VSLSWTQGNDSAGVPLLEAAGEGTKMADHLSLGFRPAFPSSAIISERSSPSRVRFAAPNNGAPLTAPGRSKQRLLIRGKGSLRTAPPAGGHFAAILVPFSTATDMPWQCAGPQVAVSHRR